MPRPTDTSDKDMVIMSARIPADLLKTAKKLAIDLDMSFQSAVAEALRSWISSQDKE